MIELAILGESESASWNSVVEEFSEATLFHTSEWISFLESSFGLRKLLLGIYKDSQIVGVFPCLLTRKGPFKILGSPLRGWGTAYMGPLVEKGLLQEVMFEFDRLLRKLGIDYVEFSFGEHEEIPRDLLDERGYVCEQTFTWILDLEGGEQKLWSNLGDNCRNKVRKGIKNQVAIVEPVGTQWVEEFYPMLLDSLHKHGTSSGKSKTVYHKLQDSLGAAGLKVLLAQHEGKTIAGGIFPFYKDTVYFWSGGSYGEYNWLAPNNLLQWSLIKWASDNGLRRYDMYGKGIPSIDRFKLSFGSREASYIRCWKAMNPVVRLARDAYSRGVTVERRIRSVF